MPTKQKILIVEDDSDVRRLYALALNQRGYEVKLASNGAEALDRVEHEQPDVVLLDLFMPVMNGWEVLERINPVNGERNIPVIVVTGHTDQQPAGHHSIVAWLSKPVALEELTDTIQRALRPGGNGNGKG